MKIIAARPIRYDETTDIRAYWADVEALDDETLACLHNALDNGQATAAPGLMGWAPYTHTVHWGAYTLHAEIED